MRWCPAIVVWNLLTILSSVLLVMNCQWRVCWEKHLQLYRRASSVLQIQSQQHRWAYSSPLSEGPNNTVRQMSPPHSLKRGTCSGSCFLVHDDCDLQWLLLWRRPTRGDFRSWTARMRARHRLSTGEDRWTVRGGLLVTGWGFSLFYLVF